MGGLAVDHMRFMHQLQLADHCACSVRSDQSA